MAGHDWIHGPAVNKKTGQVNYFSPSALQLGDMSTEQGCERKYIYAYKEGKKEPETWQQKMGTADHAIVERYLLTGERRFNPRVAKGIHLLPPPGPDLQVEHDMIPRLLDAEGKEISGLHLSPLKVDGIPIVGRIDLMHDRGLNYGSESVEYTHDPEGTIEVLDHKFVGSLRYIKQGHELAKTVQMVVYGKYVFTVVPDVKWVRLSHVYYPTEGTARKSTVRVNKEQIDAFWEEHIVPLVRSIANAAKQPTDLAPANLKACKAFNKLCMHAPYCSAGSQVGLAAHVGQTATSNLLKALKKTPDMALIPGKSLLAHIKQPAKSAPTADAKPDTSAADKAAELAKLKAEEETLKAAKRKASVPSWFDETWKAILSFEKGQPQISGAAAKVYAAYQGHSDPGPNQGFGGTKAADGSDGLSVVNITDPEEFKTLLDELTEAFGGEIQVQDVVMGVVTDVGLVPSDTPEVVLNTSTEVPKTEVQTGLAAIADAAEKTPAKKPRASKKSKAESPTETKPSEETLQPFRDALARDTSGPVTVTEGDQERADSELEVSGLPQITSFNLILDGMVVEGKLPDLAPVVDAFLAILEKQFDVQDVRAGEGPNHPLGFGKWKGVLKASTLAYDGWSAGMWRLDVRGNEVYEEVAQALRQLCRQTGGMWVRGVGR